VPKQKQTLNRVEYKSMFRKQFGFSFCFCVCSGQTRNMQTHITVKSMTCFEAMQIVYRGFLRSISWSLLETFKFAFTFSLPYNTFLTHCSSIVTWLATNGRVGSELSMRARECPRVPEGCRRRCDYYSGTQTAPLAEGLVDDKMTSPSLTGHKMQLRQVFY
jgi:hypothetical protein